MTGDRLAGRLAACAVTLNDLLPFFCFLVICMCCCFASCGLPLLSWLGWLCGRPGRPRLPWMSGVSCLPAWLGHRRRPCHQDVHVRGAQGVPRLQERTLESWLLAQLPDRLRGCLVAWLSGYPAVKLLNRMAVAQLRALTAACNLPVTKNTSWLACLPTCSLAD